MNCPKCKHKITLANIFLALNPFKIKCKNCDSKLLASKNLKSAIIAGAVIGALIGAYIGAQLGDVKTDLLKLAISWSILVIIVGVIVMKIGEYHEESSQG